ncbi:MnmC family methyltransferase [Bdellovibrio sp. HCB290]|uniref:MnmC family methyltransferase n=1 Tax=Bdellovibrio sp. HCB290 TaxID=3394356 RepID=UPI0039B64C1B
MKSWQDLGFEIEITKDQSPTLRLLQSLDPSKEFGESMHHSGGASTETTHLYGNVAADVLGKVKDPHFMVVGLGLGYIEMNIAREAIKKNASVGLITSYESIPELSEFFIEWLHDRGGNLPIEVADVYDQVLKHVLSENSISDKELKSFLRNHFETVKDVQGPLGENTEFVSRYHGFFYDAYSSKTHPHLWDEVFLNRLLSEAASSQCSLSTYAVKGTLKRALKNHGFQVIEREGFFSKRGSTLGVRGWIDL